MNHFSQQPAETPAAWLARLTAAGIGELTHEQRRDLAQQIGAAHQAAGWVPPTHFNPEAVAARLVVVAPAASGGSPGRRGTQAAAHPAAQLHAVAAPPPAEARALSGRPSGPTRPARSARPRRPGRRAGRG